MNCFIKPRIKLLFLLKLQLVFTNLRSCKIPRLLTLKLKFN